MQFNNDWTMKPLRKECPQCTEDTFILSARESTAREVTYFYRCTRCKHIENVAQ